MKKTLTVLLICALVLAMFTGCGKKVQEVEEAVEEAAQQAEEVAETVEAEVEEAVEEVEQAVEEVTEPAPELTTEFEPIEYHGRVVEYDHCELAEDDDGEFQFLVYFKYTNNGDKAQSFSMGLDVQVYSEGEQVEEVWYPVNDEAIDRYDDEIEVGETVLVANAYEYPPSFPVTIKVDPWYDVGDVPLMEIVVEP